MAAGAGATGRLSSCRCRKLALVGRRFAKCTGTDVSEVLTIGTDTYSPITVHVAGDNPDEVRKTDMIVRR